MNNLKKIVKRTARKTAWSSVKKTILLTLRPVDYVRTRELPAVLELADIFHKKSTKLRILDVASPQLLSCTLCRYSPDWEVTYINSFQEELDDLYLKKHLLQLKNLQIKEADITKSENFLEDFGRFDYIFSSSVIEHIHPEKGGDSTAVEIIAKLLKPGGTFIFSVPFYKKGFHEYKEGGEYAAKGEKSDKIFFQRFYDPQTLRQQMIEPSGLQLADELYLGERYYHSDNINKRLAAKLGGKYTSLLLGKFYFLLSRIFMTSNKDSSRLKKPYIAVIALKKNENSIHNNC